MSRHQLQPRADRLDVFEAFIGWDRPLGTFFVQAYPVDEDEDLLLWRGTRLGELPDVDAAIAAIAPFAAVPDAVRAKLEVDRAGGAGERDGQVQQLLKGAGVIR